ncbi:MAG: HNH endonuclease signature motif containing protein [Candidatus Sericytochromatia bacterium]
MCSSKPDMVFAALETLEAGIEALAGSAFDALSEKDCVSVCERLMTVGRKIPSAQYELVNQLSERAVASDIGGPLARVLADRLKIRPGAARRLIAEAGQVGHRRALSGERLEPLWPTVSAQVRAGAIGAEHVAVIRDFYHQLPAFVGFAERERAEQMLGAMAADLRPDQLQKAAERMAALINPDGQFSDVDRARKRGFYWGRQGSDGMSTATLIADPQLRAALDAVIAKLGAPGMCNPEDTSPTIDGEPSQESVRRDTRTRAQRAHDALAATARAVLASGQLGQHRGLPATIIVRTTLQKLESGRGKAETGGGSWLPMRDVITQASAAHHYLAVFDKHSNRPLYLGRTRIASADQRIVLHARDGGCTAPGCDKPGYECEVMHLKAHARDGLTQPDNLALGCHTDHKLHDEGWSTRLNADGIVEWLPPPHLNRKPGINNFFHPERYLPDNEDDP